VAAAEHGRKHTRIYRVQVKSCCLSRLARDTGTEQKQNVLLSIAAVHAVCSYQVLQRQAPGSTNAPSC
jgi:hypothetical protein